MTRHRYGFIKYFRRRDLSQDPWDDILKPGEEVLWQGKPEAPFRSTNLFQWYFSEPSRVINAFMYCVVLVLLIFNFLSDQLANFGSATQLCQDGASVNNPVCDNSRNRIRPGMYTFIALLFAPLIVFVFSIYWPRFRTRRTFFTLTNYAAYIGIRYPFAGLFLRCIPITKQLSVELRYEPQRSIVFGGERNLPFLLELLGIHKWVGFFNIKDARSVATMINDIKAGFQ